jgi:hypothetical protein
MKYVLSGACLFQPERIAAPFVDDAAQGQF